MDALTVVLPTLPPSALQGGLGRKALGRLSLPACPVRSPVAQDPQPRASRLAGREDAVRILPHSSLASPNRLRKGPGKVQVAWGSLVLECGWCLKG